MIKLKKVIKLEEIIKVNKMTKYESRKHEAVPSQKLPLISVIVPVYQVSKYIRECVDSLLCQTYRRLEIILVDDGSTDGSGEICDSYAKEDDRIRVIHQENRGLSAARNTGLDYASGEYVAFVDSDDYVEPAYIEELYRLIVEYRADIAACMFVRVGETEESQKTQDRRNRAAGGRRSYFAHKVKQSMEMTDITGVGREQTAKTAEPKAGTNKMEGLETREICLSSEQMLRRWHGRYKKWETVAWNKLYHKSVFGWCTEDEAGRTGESREGEWSDRKAQNGKIRFPEGRKHEDVLTSHRIVGNAKRIVLTTQVFYLYRVREGNITSKMASKEGRRQNLSAQKERMRFFRERGYWRAYLNLLRGYLLHLGWFGWMRVRR
mgnify:CR=1 FL=1